jgi:transmembrane sensor
MLPVDRKAALRREAAQWFARMDGPDADRHRLAFERWRKADPAHAKAYADMLATWRDAGLIALTPTGRNRSLDRVRRPFHHGRGWRPALAAASVIMLSLALAAYFHRELSGLFRPGNVEIATDVGVLRTQRLADGSMVTLDTDSAIVADLGATARIVRLTHGRARFDVAHDPSRPFKVEAGAGEIVARGTLFDVDLSHPALQVTLYRGSVDVSVDRKDGAAPLVRRLSPGHRFTEADDGFEPLISATPNGDDRWTAGMLSFNSAVLADVAAQANRYSNQRILVSPSVAGLKVTGVFRSGRNEDLARSLASMFNLPLRRNARGDWTLGA